MDRHIKKGIAEIFDKLAWACMGSLVTCIIYLKMDIALKVMLIMAVFAIGAAYMAVGYFMSVNKLKIRISDDNIQTTRKGIESIVLLNEEKKVIKSFKIVGKAGLVIGKSVENNMVDVDLSDLAVSETISEEHAVLNYSNGNWYIEDSDSISGKIGRAHV